jgi:plasmid rolling circle replication initiator protein Rep
MEIQVKKVKVYGNQKFYPVCEKANLLVELNNRKTLTTNSIDIIKRLGYAIRVINTNPETYL